MSAQLATQEKPLNSAWSREESWVCTGVSVGCSRVNSSSKLLVSAVPFYDAGVRLRKYQEKTTMATHDCREVGWGNALVQHVIKVNIFEEWMSLDLLSVTLTGAETPGRVSCEQLQASSIIQYFVWKKKASRVPSGVPRRRHAAS